MVRLEAELLPDEAAAVMAMIEVRQAVSAETGERLSRADALVRIAQEKATPEGAKPELPQSGIVVHFSPETLGDGYSAELDDGTRVPAETFRRVACDAKLDAIVEDSGGEVLSVGRRTRVVPPAMRRAFETRDKSAAPRYLMA
jgi:hypothetical protein